MDMEIGKIGMFTFMDGMPVAESAEFVRKLERLNYGVLWFPEAWGRDPFAHAAYLMSKTEKLKLATGIANIYARDAIAMAACAKTVAEMGEGRFILGLGVSHTSLVKDLRGHDHSKPYSYMRDYLAKLKSASYSAVAPRNDPPILIAALHPKMLALAGAEASGTHTYLVTAEHTAKARAIIGKDAWICVGQTTILEKDPSRARAAAREHLKFYSAQPNYQRNMRSMGFGDSDLAGGLSDRLIDALIAWGDEGKIRKHFDEHFAAGANHVCIMPVRPDGKPGPDERAIEALAP